MAMSAAAVLTSGTPDNFDRTFDYSQHVLVAVEYAAAPTLLDGLPDSYTVFRRLSIAELVEALKGRPDGPPAGGQFERVLAEHMGYWEQRVPAGQQCFVHYAIGQPSAIAGAFDRLRGQLGSWPVLGTYHLEPQSSAYPFGFPDKPVPDHWQLGQARPFSEASVFWFNFFPAQQHLFEKTFVIWSRFCQSQLPERGDCNQLVASDGAERLQANGVDEFVQVNLNRFSSLAGYLASAKAAGESTFTVDPDYRWYGMLLRKV